jgi:hypothetical protein
MGRQRAQRTKREPAHSENGNHVTAWQTRVPAAAERDRYHYDKQGRSEAAHPPEGCLLLRSRPAQRGKGRAARGVCAHLTNTTAGRPERHQFQGARPGLTQGGYSSTRGCSVADWQMCNPAPTTCPLPYRTLAPQPATPRIRDASSLPPFGESDDRLLATVLVVRLPLAAAVAGRGIG